MNYAVGSLVKTRGREWLVLPESDEELLMLRPLGGADDEVTGVYLPLETVEPARFDLPTAEDLGDYQSCRLLRDAVRLGFRNSAGPLRSLARLAVEPRPYQLVPLLMALKLDPVRLLIADDVGVGKTIEAGLITRELLDRGEVQRLAVLSPPHLAEQWQAELRNKFHIDAELVLPSTAARLERHLGIGDSIFEQHPHVVVSMDFIKSDRRREDFVRACPELVIVDEAHTCAFVAEARGGKHLRFDLVKRLAEAPSRHMLFVTATPHSGKESVFRSLLAFLNPDFTNLPDDLSGKENEKHRRRLAQYFIQRRRADIEHYMNEDTPFPKREEAEDTYTLHAEYKKLFDKVLRFAREIVHDDSTHTHRQRVRWWSALALLRSLASSPAAAEATLRNRAATADTETPEEADEVGRRTVLDMDADELDETLDIAPGSDDSHEEQSHRDRLLRLASEARKLYGDKDAKLKKGIPLIKRLVKDGFRPVVFCRFIPTAEYLTEHLRPALPKDVEIEAITGALPPAERETRVLNLAEHDKRVLVCTDCLSEGINLQEYFDAVVHYDLSWSPTRHEQREGRVDRFGQPKANVRVLTYYGQDNQIDGIVLDVLIRKHKNIRSSLGISVAVPTDTNKVIEAVFEGLLLREQTTSAQGHLPGLEEYFSAEQQRLHAEWERAAGREKRSRTMFAQESIKVEEVTRELQAVRDAIGSSADVERFVKQAVRMHRGFVAEASPKEVPADSLLVSADSGKLHRVNVKEAPRALKDAVGVNDELLAAFRPVEDTGVAYLHRTHPFVEGLANYVMNTALDPRLEGAARRAGVIRTTQVDKRTALLLLRLRFHIVEKRRSGERALLAEDCRVLGFRGSPANAEWLDNAAVQELIDSEPEGNVPPDQARHFLDRLFENFGALQPYLDDYARARANELLNAHRRVRKEAGVKGVTYDVEPHLPLDVLGVYMLLPIAR